MRTLYLDVASTGMDLASDRVVEIGMTELINGKESGRIFHHYLYPGNLVIEEYAADVNGYDLDFLVEKPSFANITDELITFVKDAEVVSLETAFDIGFLDAELSRINMQPLENFCYTVINLRKMARELAPKEPALLSYLLKKYHIEVPSCHTMPATLQSIVLLYKLHEELIAADAKYLDTM